MSKLTARARAVTRVGHGAVVAPGLTLVQIAVDETVGREPPADVDARSEDGGRAGQLTRAHLIEREARSRDEKVITLIESRSDGNVEGTATTTR